MSKYNKSIQYRRHNSKFYEQAKQAQLQLEKSQLREDEQFAKYLDTDNEESEALTQTYEHHLTGKGATKMQLSRLTTSVLVGRPMGQRKCYICTDKMLVRDTVIYLDCGHVFHKECISSWLLVNNQCPVDKSLACR